MIYKQLHPTNDFKDIKQVCKNADLNFEELKRIDKLQPEGSILYRYYDEPYADGKIHWQIIKVNKTTCNIMACEGINLDEWQKGVHSVNIGYAQEMIKRRVKIENYFKK